MIVAIALLLLCQLLGEALARGLSLPIPGPVLGMLILLVLLLNSQRLRELTALNRLTAGLLKHLSLLFIPAAVGVMVHADLLKQQWLAIILTMIASTAVTMAVTGWVMQRLLDRQRRRSA